MGTGPMNRRESPEIDKVEIAIRPARPGEAAALSALAMRSKAHWGYDDAFLEACRAELTLTEAQIVAWAVHVAETGGRAAGFHAISAGSDDGGEVEMLFVEPDMIGRGIGRSLWRHLVETARSIGIAELGLVSDPGAEPFYLAMGCVRMGEMPSTVDPGRMLPRLRFSVSNPLTPPLPRPSN